VIVALSAQPPGVNELCVCVEQGPLLKSPRSVIGCESDRFSNLSNDSLSAFLGWTSYH